jgi:hypothetical protein
MRIIPQNPLARLFKTNRKQDTDKIDLPYSAQRSIEKSNQPRPFNINRDAHGTRPWHSYVAKKPK